MNNTEKCDNSRQLHIEGYLQKDRVELEEYVGVPSISLTLDKKQNAENKYANGLLERIIDKNNLNQAYKRIKANIGSHGIDGMKVDELLQYLKENGDSLRQSLLEGSYKPTPVRRVEIPKPLSPLLSNIMLNELDKELERRGHRFVRYADDCMIFCKSRKSAVRTLENILPYIEKKLFLKVNRRKTKVAHVSKVKYLGYGFYRYKGKCKMRVHPKSIAKMRARLKELTARNNGWGNERRALKLKQFIRGWVNYFSLADMKQVLRNTDEWVRRRIRAVYWRQWKKVKTRYRMIQKFGLPEWKVHEMANCRKGTWRAAIMLNSVLTNKEVASLGYMSMADYYLKICEN